MNLKNKFKGIYVFFIFYFFVQLFVIFKTPLLKWDEAVYVGIGKFIFSNSKLGLYESFRPSLLPILEGFIWFLGFKDVFFYRLIPLFFSLGTLYLFYKILNKEFSEGISLLGTILLGVVPIYFIFSTKVMTSLIAGFFVLLAYYFYLEKRYYLVSLFLGLAFLTRFPSGLFFPIFMLMIFLKEKLYLFKLDILFDKFLFCFKLGIIFLISISPFFILNWWFGYGLIKPLLHALVHQGNSVFGNDIWFYFNELWRMSPFIVFFIPGVIKLIRDRKYELLFLSIIPFIYFLQILNKQTRFLNLFLPFLVLVSIYGFMFIFNRFKFKEIILLIFILLSFLHFGSYDYEFLYGREVPGVYYLEDGKTYLTSSPEFVAYTEAKFIPFYSGVYEGRDVLYEEKDFVDKIIYFSDAFPCEYYPSIEDCLLYKEDMEFQLLNKKLVKNESGFLIYE